MKSLSILGTAAMFTVGGSILVHGIGHRGFVSWLITTVLDALFGVLAGAVAVGLMMIVKRLRPAASKTPGPTPSPGH